MNMDEQSLTPLHHTRDFPRNVGCVELLALTVGTILFVVGYTSNGLYIERIAMKTIRGKLWYSTRSYGVWYSTACHYDEKCVTRSLKKLHDVGFIDDYSYMDMVGDQVCLSLALGCIFMAISLNILGYRRHIPDHQRRIGAISSLLIAVVFLTEFCGREGRRQHIIITKSIVFPWSLACLGASDLLIFVSACLCVFTYIRNLPHQNVNNEEPKLCKKTTFKIEILVCVLSVFLQIVGFSSNGITIEKENANGEIGRYGVWYFTVCPNATSSNDCETKSRAQQIDDYRKEGTNVDVFESGVVETQVIMTIALLCDILAAVLYFLCLCDRITQRQMRFSVLVCSILSGTFVLQYCAYVGRYDHFRAFNDPLYTIYFPWGLFMYGLGGVLILITAAICFTVQFFLGKEIIPQETELQIKTNSDRLNTNSDSNHFEIPV